jgi:hypothetical protein
MEEGGAEHKTRGVLEGAGEKLHELVSDDDDGRERQTSRRSRRGED